MIAHTLAVTPTASDKPSEQQNFFSTNGGGRPRAQLSTTAEEGGMESFDIVVHGVEATWATCLVDMNKQRVRSGEG